MASDPAECCGKKTVGEHSYTWVNMTDSSIPEQCINRCIYTRDDPAGSQLYCFKSGSLSVNCTQAPAITEVLHRNNQTYEDEEGNVYVQESTYNPNTNIATISVPSHGNRTGIQVNILPNKILVTIKDNLCLVSTTPDSVNPSDIMARDKNSDKRQPQPENVVYAFQEFDGDLSAAEKNAVDSMAECKGMEIFKVTDVVVSEQEFNEFVNAANSELSQLPRQISTCEVEEKCSTR